MKYFIFNNIDSRDLFLVNEIKRQLHAPMQLRSVQVPHKAGAYYAGRDFGVLEFEVTFTALEANNTLLKAALEDLAGTLIEQNADKQPKDLIISDYKDRRYLAYYEADSDIEAILLGGGTAKISFFCFDPFGYALTEQSILLNNDTPTVLTNAGTAAAFPRFRIVPTETVSYIRIDNTTTNKFILLNRTTAAWSRIIIDCFNNSVYDEDTGASMLQDVDISSRFFALEKGENTIEITPALKLSARAMFTNRYY